MRTTEARHVLPGSFRTLIGPGRPVGGPCRSNGPAAGSATISLDALGIKISSILRTYDNNKMGRVIYHDGILYEIRKMQVDEGMLLDPLPTERKPGPAHVALHAAKMLLATAREFKSRGQLDHAKVCLLSGCLEFTFDRDALHGNTSGLVDHSLVMVEELNGIRETASAEGALRKLLDLFNDQSGRYTGLSDQEISRIAILMAKMGNMDKGISILMKKKPGGQMPLHFGKPRPSVISRWETNRFYYLAKEWPDFYRENQETLNAQALEAVRKGVRSWREQGIDTNGVESYELPVIETLMKHSPLAALAAYQRILLPLVSRETPIDPAYALKPIVEAIEEVSGRPEAAEAFPSTPSMLILYMTGVANFVRAVLVEKGINPQEGLWHEIPILIRAFPSPQFATAMKAFEELYLAYQDSTRDLNPKAMRQILPLLPREKFIAGLKSMADMVRTGIDPATRLDELVR